VQRIAVVGAVGAGKSTVARELAERLDLPLVDLDAIYWSRGIRPSEEAWRLLHSAIIRQPAWILDGDYRAVQPERFAVADLVVWVDPPRSVRVLRVARRELHGYRALHRCLRWTWRYERVGRTETAAALLMLDELRVRRIRQRADLDQLLVDLLDDGTTDCMPSARCRVPDRL
jgi:adenylate kinase family enzyme